MVFLSYIIVVNKTPPLAVFLPPGSVADAERVFPDRWEPADVLVQRGSDTGRDRGAVLARPQRR